MHNPASAMRHLEACIMVATADCESVLELGCGIGDKLALCACDRRHGVEAHRPYIERAKTRWGKRLFIEHVEATTFIAQAAKEQKTWDAIMLIDFLEHLPTKGGKTLLATCQNRLAKRRIIVYCPEGDQPQDSDVYDLGGDTWQTHRSAWSLDDLQELGFDVVRWEDRHGPGLHALFAIWNQS